MDGLKKSGMVLGNHSYSHSGGFAFKTTTNICDELSRTEKLLGSHSISIFRSPFGITSPQIARAVRKMELKSIGWRVRSLDTVINDKDKLISKVVNISKGGSIILLHETGKTTATCLDEMIIKLKSSGLDIATNQEIHKLLHA
jgi:peptidoglycan/xylan/chitin deacetylase (PgdA/CDA1 family)